MDQFSPRQSRPHFKIASIAAAGASQSKDRNDKQKTGFFDSIGQTETNDHVSGTSALDRTPEESANYRPGGLVPGAGISVPEKRPFIPLSATMLFFPLFLLGRSRNLRERGGRRGDVRLLLFWLFGFPVATNLTFRHRNSPSRKLTGCKHNIIRSAVVSVKSRPTRSNAGANNPTSTHLHDVFYYRNLFCS